MRPFMEIYNEGRTSQHQFNDMSLQDAYKICYETFKDLGFMTAASFAVFDFVYRLLPDSIKTPDIQQQKRKSFGAYVRPFVINLINDNQDNIDIGKLKQNMVNRELIKQYLDKPDHGHRRKGKLKALSAQAGREITRDY